MSAAPPSQAPDTRYAPWITWRSILLGLLVVIVVSALAPFNDFVVANTVLVGSYIPVPLFIVCFFLIIFVNAPLHRWKPGFALRGGELAVILAMMSAGCSVTFRQYMFMLAAPFHIGQTNAPFFNAFTELKLPAWLFPVAPVAGSQNNPIVVQYFGRVPPGGRVPYFAWITPLLCWGLFICAAAALMLSLACIVRRQWAVNERLAFPLAKLQLALIEPPKEGRFFNDLIGSRSFWVAALGVLVIHSLSGLHTYFPKRVPIVPLEFDLSAIMANPPWFYFNDAVKSATIYFTFVGITYFIQARIAFSLWSIFLLTELANVQLQQMQTDLPVTATNDQHLGSAVVFFASALWIGRRHWLAVIRQTFRPLGAHAKDFGSYRLAVIVAIVSTAIMFGWLIVAGVHLWMAAMIIAFIFVTHVVTARLVAETGLPFYRTTATIEQLYTNLPPSMMSGTDIVISGIAMGSGPLGTRGSVLAYSVQSLEIAAGTDPPPRQRLGIVGLVGLSLIISAIVGASSSLWCNYHYAMPLTTNVTRSTKEYPMLQATAGIITPLPAWKSGRFAAKSYNPWAQMAIGAAITAFLQLATWRWQSWPLAPVGFLVSHSWYIQTAWVSLFIGWLAKVLILRLGGAKLFQASRPFFVGLIFGEALATAVWLIITLLLALLGVDYRPINFMPA